MEIPTTYDPGTCEEKWYAYWLEHDFFESKPDDREPYTVVIPPPNVTGVLHMGHMSTTPSKTFWFAARA